MLVTETRHRPILQDIAERVMTEKGLEPYFSPEALEQLERVEANDTARHRVRDMRDRLWCSIDNDDSRDLDQLTLAEKLPGGRVKIFVAIADVDSLVPQESPLDRQARHNTTSVYTAARIFPMLPEKLSTDLTSLNPNEDRLAIVVEMVVNQNGSIQQSDVYRACVRNHAKLAYRSTGAWLEKRGEIPPAIAAVPGLRENIQLQAEVAQKLKEFRYMNGALNFETLKYKPRFKGDDVSSLDIERPNLATELIQDFMIAANGVTARFLDSKGFSSIRRVVRSPERWERIVELARELGERLPKHADSLALEEFLRARKSADPLRFPDLSLTVIKLMGSGEYVCESPGKKGDGHFGLAVRDYNHSTAPNRRYPDLITQRLLKAAIEGRPSPYTDAELTALAEHCTKQEDAAKKTERHVGKSAAALLLRRRVGENFEALVTGVKRDATWVRLLNLPVEGRLVKGMDGLDVGDRIVAKLIYTDAQRGYIDFQRVRG